MSTELEDLGEGWVNTHLDSILLVENCPKDKPFFAFTAWGVEREKGETALGFQCEGENYLFAAIIEAVCEKDTTLIPALLAGVKQFVVKADEEKRKKYIEGIKVIFDLNG